MSADSFDYEVIIIGGGQAGLALGYELKQRRRSFIILDASPTIGYSWRSRWDSLRLFTPAAIDALPGMPFPGPPNAFPSKDQVADYLEQYAAAWRLPVLLNQRVTDVARHGKGYRVHTENAQFLAQNVVIATGAFQRPFVPAISAALPPDVFQVHSSGYHNPRQLPPGPALVVGGANSGVQIAHELAHTRSVTLSVGEWLQSVSPRLIRSVLFWRVLRALGTYITIDSPVGQRFSTTESLFGTSLAGLQHQGVRIVGRSESVADSRVFFRGGGMLAPRAVVWATGYTPDYHWLHVPVLDASGHIIHRHGATPSPGLYVLGMEWQRYFGSSMLGGVGRDATLLAATIDSKTAS